MGVKSPREDPGAQRGDMFKRSDHYIDLNESSGTESRDTGLWIFRENRVTELSGRKWRWVWNRPRGIVLQKGSSKKGFPILDLSRILQAFLYGVSIIVVMIGVGKMIGGYSGE